MQNTKPNTAGIGVFSLGMEFLYKLTRSVVAVCLILITLMVVIDVMLRSLTGTGLQGTVEINEYVLVIVGFLAIFQTHYERGNVSVDLLFRKFPAPVKKVIERINNGLVLVFGLLFMYAGAVRFWSAFQEGETSWFGSNVLPVWYVRIIVPIACFALCLQSIVNIVKPDISCD